MHYAEQRAYIELEIEGRGIRPLLRRRQCLPLSEGGARARLGSTFEQHSETEGAGKTWYVGFAPCKLHLFTLIFPLPQTRKTAQ